MNHAQDAGSFIWPVDSQSSAGVWLPSKHPIYFLRNNFSVKKDNYEWRIQRHLTKIQISDPWILRLPSQTLVLNAHYRYVLFHCLTGPSSSKILHCEATLGQRQPGLIWWILLWIQVWDQLLNVLTCSPTVLRMPPETAQQHKTLIQESNIYHIEQTLVTLVKGALPIWNIEASKSNKL